MIELTNTKQWKDEPVVDYINRWHMLSLNCKDKLSEVSVGHKAYIGDFFTFSKGSSLVPLKNWQFVLMTWSLALPIMVKPILLVTRGKIEKMGVKMTNPLRELPKIRWSSTLPY